MSNLRLVTKMAYPLGADAENKLVHEQNKCGKRCKLTSISK